MDHDQHSIEGALSCSVCGSIVAEDWEYLQCAGCKAIVCSACIRRIDGYRMCPVCSTELVPRTGPSCSITGVCEDVPADWAPCFLSSERVQLPTI